MVLIAGIIEKPNGRRQADYGLVGIYGILRFTRLLVPKGELEASDRHFKLPNQRGYGRFGQNPLPIYSCVWNNTPDIPRLLPNMADMFPLSRLPLSLSPWGCISWATEPSRRHYYLSLRTLNHQLINHAETFDHGNVSRFVQPP